VQRMHTSTHTNTHIYTRTHTHTHTETQTPTHTQHARAPARAQRTVEDSTEKRTKDTYGPPMGKRLVMFIDDLNMPRVDQYGTQQPIAFLKLFIERKWVPLGARRAGRGCLYGGVAAGAGVGGRALIQHEHARVLEARGACIRGRERGGCGVYESERKEQGVRGWARGVKCFGQLRMDCAVGMAKGHSWLKLEPWAGPHVLNSPFAPSFLWVGWLGTHTHTPAHPPAAIGWTKWQGHVRPRQGPELEEYEGRACHRGHGPTRCV